MDNFILCGMQFGDEGKGTFVDYLAHEQNIDCVVRYNGGSQASHTVVTPSQVVHKFSQLGSGMFLGSCHTYLTENMVVNLDNLLVEMDIFSKKTGIQLSDLISRIHIHENCFVVTPYHKLINKLREFSLGENRRGTVGTGVSEVRYLLSEPKTFPYEPSLGIQVKDIFNPDSRNFVIGRMEALENYAFRLYNKNKDTIWQNVPNEMKEGLQEEITDLLKTPKAFIGFAVSYMDFARFLNSRFNFRKCLYSTYEESFRRTCNSAIFEGSQGLLIDGTYGIKPNTTFLDTTNNFALDISYYRDDITKVGIAKAFTSRHGLGVFPTESEEVSSKISDENQEETFWNGKIRFGWFDAVLLRYAQRINHVNELYLSSLDKLDGFETIKICNEYIYNGKIDDEFKSYFYFYISPNGEVIIRNIKRSGDKLSEYLQNCTPSYITVDGWMRDTSKVTDFSMLPVKCRRYINTIEKTTGIYVTAISVGPTRENKIRNIS